MPRKQRPAQRKLESRPQYWARLLERLARALVLWERKRRNDV
jgi:hypothetical protein